ncbi:hypothetical protein [Agromyces laixinhei]|uniref:hypothetical protein n=1 Tax=Agromyces laixinhei TaxID=2585717 RepID=UPI0012ED5846|nr:hypothetical protein [Agromyces laixinhei]
MDSEIEGAVEQQVACRVCAQLVGAHLVGAQLVGAQLVGAEFIDAKPFSARAFSLDRRADFGGRRSDHEGRTRVPEEHERRAAETWYTALPSRPVDRTTWGIDATRSCTSSAVAGRVSSMPQR